MNHIIERVWVTQSGLPAVALFNNLSGARCGYVGLPKEHPLHGASYNEPHKALIRPGHEEPIGKRGIIPLFCASMSSDPDRAMAPDVVFDVHGGITFSDKAYFIKDEHDLWWFGFDCNHCDDAPSPEWIADRKRRHPDIAHIYDPHPGQTHRDLAYVIAECESLAAQMFTRVNIPSEIIP